MNKWVGPPKGHNHRQIQQANAEVAALEVPSASEPVVSASLDLVANTGRTRSDHLRVPPTCQTDSTISGCSSAFPSLRGLVASRDRRRWLTAAPPVNLRSRQTGPRCWRRAAIYLGVDQTSLARLKALAAAKFRRNRPSTRTSWATRWGTHINIDVLNAENQLYQTRQGFCQGRPRHPSWPRLRLEGCRRRPGRRPAAG